MKKAFVIIILVIFVGGSLLPISRYMVKIGFEKYRKPWAAGVVVTGARMQMYMMRYAEARAIFDRALTVFPAYPRRDRLVFNIAFCFEKEGNDKEAIEWYGRFVSTWPKHLWVDQARDRANDLEASIM